MESRASLSSLMYPQERGEEAYLLCAGSGKEFTSEKPELG